MPIIVPEVLLIIPTSSGLIYTPSSSYLSTPMKELLVRPVTPDHDIQWLFFCQSSHFILSLCYILQKCSFQSLDYGTAYYPENYYLHGSLISSFFKIYFKPSKY